MCKMYEMKMNNLLVDVEIFSLCRKETLIQAEFQQQEALWATYLTRQLGA